MASVQDTVYIALPIALLAAVAVGLRRHPRVSGAIAGSLLAGLTLGSVVLGHETPADLPPETADSPVAFTAREIVKHLSEPEDTDGEDPEGGDRGAGGARSAQRGGGLVVSTAEAAEPRAAGGDGQDPAEEAELPTDASLAQQGTAGMRMTEPSFGAAAKVARTQPPPSDRKWNIVWVVLESHGRRYLQGDSPNGVQPMPFFVDNLAKKGWWMSRHRSPSNSSATSIFAQLSGLYPLPSTRMFSMQKDNYIPSLFSLLGPEYDSFLITPGRLNFFFPQAFLQHSGIKQLIGFHELDKKVKQSGQMGNQVRHEVDTVTYFLKRLHEAKPPFAAVYYSFTPHWEYYDYGPEFHRFKSKRQLERYLNGMYLIDKQIERIVQQLERDGLLDSTILVFAGDHGEAFGQHPANYNHSRASFDENYSTPALIVQPKLFAPKIIAHDTLHIDLLPTVLDAMGIAYDDALLQGESLWQEKPRRKYQFFWGNENTISAIRDDGLKVQLGLNDQRCWAFDLQGDPSEKKKLGCQKYGADLAVLKAWRDRQRRMLPAYSKAVREGKEFQGHRHPQVRAVAETPRKGGGKGR
jgi:hypothetical protein